MWLNLMRLTAMSTVTGKEKGEVYGIEANHQALP